MPEPMETLSGTIGTNSPDRVVPATGIFTAQRKLKSTAGNRRDSIASTLKINYPFQMLNLKGVKKGC